MASEETENSSENNLTIIFPSNTRNQSLSTKLLASWIYSNNLVKLYNSLNWSFQSGKLSSHSFTHCLPTLVDLPPKILGI